MNNLVGKIYDTCTNIISQPNKVRDERGESHDEFRERHEEKMEWFKQQKKENIVSQTQKELYDIYYIGKIGSTIHKYHQEIFDQELYNYVEDTIKGDSSIIQEGEYYKMKLQKDMYKLNIYAVKQIHELLQEGAEDKKYPGYHQLLLSPTKAYFNLANDRYSGHCAPIDSYLQQATKEELQIVLNALL